MYTITTRSVTANRKDNSPNRTPKRILSPETDDNQINPKKMKTAIILKEFAEIKQLILSTTNNIESKIRESQSSVEGNITNLADKMNQEVLSLKTSVE